MTKEEVENVIKRYSYLADAVKRDLNRAVFYIGNRKFVVAITEEIKTVCELVKIIVESEKNPFIKRMMREILSGRSDIYIMLNMPFSRNAYYARKQAFIEKIYACCIARGLVSFEEILSEEIAS